MLREKPVLGSIWDTDGGRTGCARSGRLTSLRIHTEGGLGKFTLDIRKLQPIDIGDIGSVYRRRLRRNGERRAAIPGRRELRADSLARRVRDEVVVGNEESGGVEASLNSIPRVGRLGEPSVLDRGELWGTEQARDVV